MTPGERVAGVVRAVAAAAVRDSGTAGIIVLEDRTPEGELVYEWLVRELGAERTWRAASLASNVQGVTAAEAALLAAWHAAAAEPALIAHPINRTALLLGGRLPHADLLPLGDVYASQVEQLAGGWTAPPAVEGAVRQAGGIAALDAALMRWLDERRADDEAFAALTPEAAQAVRALYDAGRWFRLRPRLVPKLGLRTPGIDLFD